MVHRVTDSVPLPWLLSCMSGPDLPNHHPFLMGLRLVGDFRNRACVGQGSWRRAGDHQGETEKRHPLELVETLGFPWDKSISP